MNPKKRSYEPETCVPIFRVLFFLKCEPGQAENFYNCSLSRHHHKSMNAFIMVKDGETIIFVYQEHSSRR